MGRKRRRQEGGEQKPHVRGQQHHGENVPDPPAAVIAVHPSGAVAVAVGPEIRIFDSRGQEEVKVLRQRVEVAPGEPDRQYIRGLSFDAAGAFLLAGADDKNQGMLLWDCATWEKLQSVRVGKRASAVSLTTDGKYMLAADKFGDVHVAPTRAAGSAEAVAAAAAEPVLLLGHYNSILTSVSVSRCGRFVATTDRDKKARVSVLPPDPLAGAHDIQSFCLGHTSFVTCSAFVAQGAQELLVTGGADGTVRLWDHLSGELLSTWGQQEQEGEEGQQDREQQQEGEGEGEAMAGAEQEGASAGGSGQGEEGAPASEAEAEAGSGAEAAGDVGEEQSSTPAVLSVAGSPDGNWVAAIVDNKDEVLLLRVDWKERALRDAGWHQLQGLHMPTQVVFGPGNRLWAVGGPPTDASTTAFLGCAAVGPDGSVDAAARQGLPTGMLERLEARDGGTEEALAAANEARRKRRAARLAQLVSKRRHYGQAEIEGRKAKRRDVRAKAAAAGAAADGQDK